MSTSHTPGPWLVNQYRHLNSIVWIDGPDRTKIATMANNKDRANARLIAAAPELLEELKACVEELEAVWQGSGGMQTTNDYAVAARNLINRIESSLS